MLCSQGTANLGLYSQSIPDAAVLYNSSSYFDDLAWGALWLHKYIGEDTYLAQVCF